jgi:hypothetical protein
MPLRNKARIGGSQNAVILALVLAVPAAADQVSSETAAVPSAAPSASAQSTTATASQIDPRTRAAWLSECRRRMGYNFIDAQHAVAKRKNRKAIAVIAVPEYDYCEAYFDDYYRTHREQSVAKPSPQASQTVSPVTTVTVTDVYGPVRRNTIRQSARQKRNGKSRQ